MSTPFWILACCYFYSLDTKQEAIIMLLLQDANNAEPTISANIENVFQSFVQELRVTSCKS